MLKTKLFLLGMAYILIAQPIWLALLWGQHMFYYLAAINAGFFLLMIWIGTQKRETGGTTSASSLRATSASLQTASLEDEDQELSSSNIEKIKIKINTTKQAPLPKGSGLYRLLAFLAGVVGFGGCVFVLWETFDFGAVLMGAAGMMLFLFVVFKGMNLWRKSMFASLYFLLFLVLAGLGVWGLFIGEHSSTKSQLKYRISTFIAGIKGEIWPSIDNPPQTTGSVLSGYFATGEILQVIHSEMDESAYGTDLIPLTGGLAEETTQLITSGAVVSWANSSIPSTADIQEELPVSEPLSTSGTINTPAPLQTPQQQLTLLQAIKHLIDTYAIPLSTSKSVKFTHLAQSHPDYPYMKTALEKKMIGSTTNPDLIVSCDVYIVMKGIAEGWTIKKSDDIKADYWKLASTKDKLNGCKQGEKLTFSTL